MVIIIVNCQLFRWVLLIRFGRFLGYFRDQSGNFLMELCGHNDFRLRDESRKSWQFEPSFRLRDEMPKPKDDKTILAHSQIFHRWELIEHTFIVTLSCHIPCKARALQECGCHLLSDYSQGVRQRYVAERVPSR